jgi:hypothetical protein
VRHLIGVKVKLVAFLTLAPYGGECPTNNLVLGNLFHP